MQRSSDELFFVQGAIIVAIRRGKIVRTNEPHELLFADDSITIPEGANWRPVNMEDPNILCCIASLSIWTEQLLNGLIAPDDLLLGQRTYYLLLYVTCSSLIYLSDSLVLSC